MRADKNKWSHPKRFIERYGVLEKITLVKEEHGLTTKGEQYLIMEFIEGPGLNSLVIGRDEKILGGIRVTLLREIAEAIEAVHQAGYIHRDICPRNLMIEPNEGMKFSRNASNPNPRAMSTPRTQRISPTSRPVMPLRTILVVM